MPSLTLLIGLYLTLCQIASAADQGPEYFVVLLEGKKVGYAVHTRTVSEDRITTSEQVYVSVNRVGVPVSLQMTETAIETPDGRPIGFESIQQLSTMKITVRGRVRSDGKLEVTTDSLGTQQTQLLDWPKDAVMAEGLRLLTAKHGLKEGTSYKALAFIPSLLTAVEAQITVGAKRNIALLGTTMELTEVRTTMDVAATGKITTTSFVDNDLRAHKTIMPIAGMEFEMVRCPQEVATSPIDPIELLPRMFIKSPVVIDDHARSGPISYIIVQKDQTQGLGIPQTDTQTVRRLDGRRLQITVEPIQAPEGSRFPYDGNDPQILSALRPNTFLQANERIIIDLARQAVGDTNDPAIAIKRIEQFVADYIEDKDLSIGYGSAVEVAQTRQGDCTEHAVLAAAMCRAIGIPAKVITGIAYVHRFADQTDGFGGHAWVSAYVAGRWICIDPAFKGSGRGGFGSGHIALAVGDGLPKDFFNLAVLLGQFAIEQVEVAQGTAVAADPNP